MLITKVSIVVFLLAAGTVPGLGVAADTATSLNDTSDSALVVYHFIRGAALLSRQAVALDKENGSGKDLRAAFANTIGLTHVDASAVLALASQFDAEFSDLDNRAAGIIAKAKSQRTPDGLIPPPPPELRNLQDQKDALVASLEFEANGQTKALGSCRNCMLSTSQPAVGPDYNSGKRRSCDFPVTVT